MPAPRQGRDGQPQRLRPRLQVQSEENGNKPEENASETIIGRKRMGKKTHVHPGGITTRSTWRPHGASKRWPGAWGSRTHAGWCGARAPFRAAMRYALALRRRRRRPSGCWKWRGIQRHVSLSFRPFRRRPTSVFSREAAGPRAGCARTRGLPPKLRGRIGRLGKNEKRLQKRGRLISFAPAASTAR